jgi:hypothetical protein
LLVKCQPRSDNRGLAIIPRSRTILALVLLVNAVIVLAFIYRHRPGDPEMESLAAFVLETGKATWVPAIH